ncbi:trypsin-like serine protease [Rhodanobacter sp. L36]|uniref:trypsin-like serine protease n=1 Tax=Rhodanobacter sp. L36 TaxID=1747221 RepID=UPI00131C7B62|nr:trypsin-like serine protease [Rhodanobacter sp. L36]
MLSKSLCLVLLVLSFSAGAVVIRDDVSDAKYRVPDSELPALADIPMEGQGVLIDPQWVATAAHAVTWQSGGVNEVTINHVPRHVERVVLYPGYQKLPQPLIDKAVKTGDATQIIAFLSASNDVALLKLSEPVTDVAPIAMYRSGDEMGKTIKIVGKGATGTGSRGQDVPGGHRTALRRAFNKITGVQDQWLSYTFHKPPSALPLEGISGDGDSGGPALIQVKGQWQVAGLVSWKRGKDNAILLHPGSYGQTNYNVRLSHYANWIDNVILAEKTHGGGSTVDGKNVQDRAEK